MDIFSSWRLVARQVKSQLSLTSWELCSQKNSLLEELNLRDLSFETILKKRSNFEFNMAGANLPATELSSNVIESNLAFVQAFTMKQSQDWLKERKFCIIIIKLNKTRVFALLEQKYFNAPAFPIHCIHDNPMPVILHNSSGWHMLTCECQCWTSPQSHALECLSTLAVRWLPRFLNSFPLFFVVVVVVVVGTALARAWFHSLFNMSGPWCTCLKTTAFRII